MKMQSLRSIGLIAVTMISLSSPAWAAVQGLVPGAIVHDAKGGEVGTVQSVNESEAVISTGTTKITLGLSSFWWRPTGPTIAMSRTQLEAAAARVQQKGDDAVRSQLIAGAAVFDVEGNLAASVDHLEGDDVIVVVGLRKVKLPIGAFSKGDQGARIAITAADLNAKVAAQAPPPAPTPPVQAAPQKQ